MRNTFVISTTLEQAWGKGAMRVRVRMYSSWKAVVVSVSVSLSAGVVPKTKREGEKGAG